MGDQPLRVVQGEPLGHGLVGEVDQEGDEQEGHQPGWHGHIDQDACHQHTPLSGVCRNTTFAEWASDSSYM